LWDQATQDEQKAAKQIAMTILESWVGIKTKSEAARSLSMRPVRFWQMSNQAMTGMMSGCLTQPRVRKKKGVEMEKATEAKVILDLQKQVRMLKKKIEDQEFLIDVMRTMPGMTGVGVKDDVAPVSSRLQAKHRRRVDKKAVDQRIGSGGSAGGDGSNPTQLEDPVAGS
jgi:hypothetical protein